MKTYTYKVDRYEFIVNCTPDVNGRFTCHIPAYDLIFGAKNEEFIEKKAKAMTQSFLNFYGIK